MAVSPAASDPVVMVGMAAAAVVPSYPLEFVAAVTVMARAVMVPVLDGAKVTM